MSDSTKRQASMRNVVWGLLPDQLSSNYVVDDVELADVERALLTDDTLTIRIAKALSINDSNESLKEAVASASSDESGKVFLVAMTATLRVETIVLEDISSLTKERDGSFSFIGTHHTWYGWEKNYNGGWGRHDTYVKFRLVVNPERPTSYEVIDTRERDH